MVYQKMPATINHLGAAVRLLVTVSSLLNPLQQERLPGLVTVLAGDLILGSETTLSIIQQPVFTQPSSVLILRVQDGHWPPHPLAEFLVASSRAGRQLRKRNSVLR